MATKYPAKAVLFDDIDVDLANKKWRLDKSGYAKTTINIQRRPYSRLAHRMVMQKIVNRSLTTDEVVDHVNFNRLDNRRANLRITTQQGNSQHRQPMNEVGIRGVTLVRRTGRWQSQVGCNGRRYYCGSFETAEEAGAAAARKRTELGFLN